MREPHLEREPSGIGGIQRLYQFINGYGASVVMNSFSYGGSNGTWELAVLKFNSTHILDFELTYDTPITNDVIGRLTEAEVDEYLDKIEALSGKVTKEVK